MKKDTNTIGNTKKISENWKQAVYTHTAAVGDRLSSLNASGRLFRTPIQLGLKLRLCPETQRWTDIYSLRTLVRKMSVYKRVRRRRAKQQSQSRTFALMDSRHKGSKSFLGFFFCGMSNTFAANTFLLSLVAEDEVRKKHQDVKLSWQQARKKGWGWGVFLLTSDLFHFVELFSVHEGWQKQQEPDGIFQLSCRGHKKLTSVLLFSSELWVDATNTDVTRYFSTIWPTYHSLLRNINWAPVFQHFFVFVFFPAWTLLHYFIHLVANLHAAWIDGGLQQDPRHLITLDMDFVPALFPNVMLPSQFWPDLTAIKSHPPFQSLAVFVCTCTTSTFNVKHSF